MFSSQQYLEFSRLTISPVDQTAKAEEILTQGKFPVMFYQDVFCPCTDAYMHTDKYVAKIFDNISDAENFVAQNDCDDIGLYLGRNIPGDMSEMLLEPIDNSVPF